MIVIESAFDVLVAIAAAIGFLMILIWSVRLIIELSQGAKLYVFAQLGWFQVNLAEHYGQWAVVTGSTDGIGHALARELAKRRMSILVVGRNEEKLARTKEILEAEPNVGQVETVKIDLSDPSLENFARIRQQIDPDNRDIGILVNCAGTYPDKYMRFNRYSMESMLNISNLNMISNLFMIHMTMPGMVSRGRGMIVNVSSVGGYVDVPYAGVYGCTKVFMNSLTRQLQVEYASHPIDIVLLTPGAVLTKSLKAVTAIEEPDFFSKAPDAYAKTAVNALATRSNNFSGTISHGLTKHLYTWTQSLNLFNWLAVIFLRQAAKNFELSPVPKRRTARESSNLIGGEGLNK